MKDLFENINEPIIIVNEDGKLSEAWHPLSNRVQEMMQKQIESLKYLEEYIRKKLLDSLHE